MKKRIALLLAILIIGLMFAACKTAEAGKKDTLYMSLRFNPTSFHPIDYAAESEHYVSQAIYMMLTYTTLEGAETKSDACERWDVNDDASVYTFYLKRGITFHNGEELKASDVVYSVNTAANTPANMAWGSAVDKAEAIDEYTVKVTLKYPHAAFLTVSRIYLLHEKTTEAAGESYRDNPVGCGPYKLVSYEPSHQIILKAYDGYKGTKPDYENIVYKIIPEASTALMSIEAGELDFLNADAFGMLDSIKDKKELEILVYDNTGADYVIMDNTVPPFDDLNVRLAINYAIDGERCCEVQAEGYAKPSTTVLTKMTFGFPESLKGYPYDTEKAKEYLAKAGYPNGEGFPELVIMTATMYSKYATVIQSNLADIGIKSEIQQAEMSAFVTQLLQGDVPFGIVGMGMGADASNYADVVGTGGGLNIAKYSNPKVDELFTQGKQEKDPAKRKQIYEELFTLVEQDAPYGLMSNQALLYVVRSDIDFSYAFSNRCMPYVAPQDIRRK